jgi:formiminotetrahydrofolate cyclodeaminase
VIDPTDSDASLLDRPARDLLDRFGAAQRTPGGGSAAALMGALAASLMEAVARYTIRAGLPFQERAEVLLAGVQEKSIILRAAVDEDARAFDDYWRLRTPEALERATRVPLDIADHCLALAEMGQELHEHGNPRARGEAITALLAVFAAAEAAARTADLNLRFAGTADWVGEGKDRLRTLRALLESLRMRVELD